MIYKQKYYQEIFLNALEDALHEKLISRQEEFEQYIKNREDISNFYVMLLSIHSEIFAEVYEEMTNVYNSTNLNIATGVDLDNIGAKVGLPRSKATKAYVDVTFKLSESLSEPVTIPKGIHCTTKNGISYHTVEDAYFSEYDTECTVGAIADNPGTNSRIVENQLTKLASKLSTYGVTCTVKVTNNEPSSGGTNEQTDDEYREYLLHWTETLQKGNLWAYKYYFSNFDGLDDYNIIPNWDGSGTVKVVIDPGSNYLRNLIYNDLQSTVACIDDDLNVMSYTAKTVNISTVVNVDIDQVNTFSETEKDDIQSKIEQALKVYVDGGYRANGLYYRGLRIGEDFIPHKAGVFVDEEVSELKNIIFQIPESYVVIGDDEKAEVGTVEVIME